MPTRKAMNLAALLMAGVLTVTIAAMADDDSRSNRSSDSSSDDSSSHAAGDPLHEKMEHLGDSFGQLVHAFRRAPDARQTSRYIAWSESMLKLLEAAHEMIPSRVRALPKNQQKAMLTAYRRDIRAVSQTTRKLVAKLKAGDLKRAATLIKELKRLRDAGHEKYREEEDE